MALWTPYVQDTALDLSRTTLKREPESPSRNSTVPENDNPPYTDYVFKHLHSSSHAERNLPDKQSAFYAGCAYSRSNLSVTSALSPDSVDSAWSPASTYNPQKCVSSAPSPPASPDFYDIESLSDDVEYQAFERDALRAMAEKNGGSLLGNNPRMRRAVQTNQAADDSYRKQRERNNFAAKQSRDRRKLREVRLAFQVTFLKKKMADLRARLATGVCVRCKQMC